LASFLSKSSKSSENEKYADEFVFLAKKEYNRAKRSLIELRGIMKMPLETEYMTLGQMLKEVSVISSGGQAKWYLAEHTVFVDGEPENRRGRKLYAGMRIELPDEGTFFMVKKEDADAAE